VLAEPLAHWCRTNGITTADHHHQTPITSTRPTGRERPDTGIEIDF
jgi:hypothetical protein